MRVDLFGIGIQSKSRAITAQRRINCYVEARQEQDRTRMVLVGRPARSAFISNLGNNPTRGLWSVNTLSTPLAFVVQGSTLTSISNGGVTTTITSALQTTTGDVSMADDGAFLVIVDGSFGYVYNMNTGTFTQITDGNFTTTPRTVTWQDGYFIVTSSGSRQFQLSQITPTIDPTVWPAVQINFTGAGAGNLRNGVSDHSVLNVFGDVYTEFWQNAGTPDFPFSKIQGSSAQFGLLAPWSIAKFDNSLVGIFQDNAGTRTISRMNGFSLQKISTVDVENLLYSSGSVSDAEGFSFTIGGHPFYVVRSITGKICFVFDGQSQTWSEWTDSDITMIFHPNKFAKLVDRLLVGNSSDGNVDQLSDTVYQDANGTIPMKVISKHIWEDDKYIGIDKIQIDIESGVGTATGQGVNPVVDLQVSKDGGASFYSVGFSSMGAIGAYTQRLQWNSLGAARDWVLSLTITDPVKRIVTGASAELRGASF